jgi:hypothetical protein
VIERFEIGGGGDLDGALQLPLEVVPHRLVLGEDDAGAEVRQDVYRISF